MGKLACRLSGLRHKLVPDAVWGNIQMREPVLLLLFWMLVLYFDANGWFSLSLLASFCHESGHVLVYRLLLGKWPRLYIGFTGICLPASGKALPKGKELWITAAGPLTNFILAGLVLLKMQRRTTLRRMAWLWANLLLGCFNLLPVPPLDGWHLLALLFS